ncbi:hypothetical protein ACFGVS_07870 [Mucilaginibacter sp. AW1-7]|jgi:hypothetical protein|uniref:hypothetical protein n=1 Tax=Mucilaginibacter sp. AW1-7 TaxID=3349874 RepID=UPI003F740B68
MIYITLTGPSVAITIAAYFLLRYLILTFNRYNSGCQDPFLPRINLPGSSWRDWRRGYEQGQAKMIVRYGLDKQCEDKSVLKWVKGYEDIDEGCG